MKPWREIAIPHSDVLKGTFQQAEFAVDLTAVQRGTAPEIYRNASAFFARTYITEGMRLLLTMVAQRLAGKGGEPVIQLQTAFGGGKTHTMLAVLHLATRSCHLTELPGISSVLDQANLSDVPKARVAVLDGNARGPGSPKKIGKTEIKTLWGELAWQLGGNDAFDMISSSDDVGTSPGSELLAELLQKYSPCVILVDELVAYVRQFPADGRISGGSFESNISFIQALTEAVKQVPTAVMLASLPESEIEAGQNLGVSTLRALEKIFGRVQAIWRPVATEEGFEIVRRRLFETIGNENGKISVCRAFADAYVKDANKFPVETQQERYFDRLCQAYPIHPELFDRLYQDWSTIDGFQRTRGVLKLMAKVIHRLWRMNNQDLMILPGSLPLDDNDVRNELAIHLTPGWHPIVESEIDGENSEAAKIENMETRFGQYQAVRRVTRTLFLGTAPASIATTQGVRGLDSAQILLGCCQPSQSTSVYSDALKRVSDRFTYLNISSEIGGDNTRYWFDTRANLRREMEDRKRRIDEKTDVVKKIEDCARKIFNGTRLFDGVHIFTPHSDVPDDSSLRLVLLHPSIPFNSTLPLATDSAIHAFIKNHGTQPRHRGNRLVFVAADAAVLDRLKDGVRTALAWESIVDDIASGRLNIDLAQKNQAEKFAQNAFETLPGVTRECFRWILCPMQEDPTETQVTIESFKLGTTGGSAAGELERVCRENELVIETWAPIHLREQLRNLYWKADKQASRAKDFWDDSHKYIYLPRLRSRDTFAAVIKAGSRNGDFFGTAYGYSADKYDSFNLGAEVDFDDSVLLIEPSHAKEYATRLENQAAARAAPSQNPFREIELSPQTQDASVTSNGVVNIGEVSQTIARGTIPAQEPRATKFLGTIEIQAPMAKRELTSVADEVIALLVKDAHAKVKITLDIDVEFQNGANETLKRSVNENARTLRFRNIHWE